MAWQSSVWSVGIAWGKSLACVSLAISNSRMARVSDSHLSACARRCASISRVNLSKAKSVNELPSTSSKVADVAPPDCSCG